MFVDLEVVHHQAQNLSLSSWKPCLHHHSGGIVLLPQTSSWWWNFPWKFVEFWRSICHLPGNHPISVHRKKTETMHEKGNITTKIVINRVSWLYYFHLLRAPNGVRAWELHVPKKPGLEQSDKHFQGSLLWCKELQVGNRCGPTLHGYNFRVPGSSYFPFLDRAIS